eukprot:Seg190.7 transcript_id=Seg190.7/GoldUCD/mRNA.D3Y31 product="hypothetical protein" protein_id=Seg190.7/GoldUCD/D3Y31
MGENSTIETCLFLEIHDVSGSLSIEITAIATSVIGGLSAFGSIFGNALILYLFFKYEGLRTPSNILLGSLCMTDFLTGLVVVPTIAARRITEAYGKGICSIRIICAYFSYFCVITSIVTVGLISIDRYYAIVMPFRYLRRANNQSYAIIITIEWLILGAYSLLPFLRVLTGSDFFKIAFSLMGFIITMFLVIYAKISRIVESHRRKIRPSVKLTTATNIASSGAPASQLRCSTHSRELRAESKKAHTIAIVVFVTVICYSPLAAIFVLRGIYGDTYVLVNIADPWADLIMFINSMVNPIIYCLRTKEIRDAAVKVLPERLASLLKEA